MADLTSALADSPLASEGYAFVNVTALSEAVTVSDAFTPTIKPGGVVGDHATASVAMALALTHGLVSPPAIAIARDTLRVRRPASLTSSAVASGTFTPTFRHLVRERAKARDTLTTSFTLHTALSESVKARASATLQDAKDASSSAVASDTLSTHYVAGALLEERVSALVALSPARRANIAMLEVVRPSDLATTNFHWRVALSDLVSASELYQIAGAGVTWAINTRTKAITQYANWAFNSFASVNRKYIAADQNGLYELDGARDPNAVNVAATLGSGYTRMNGTKFAGLKGVYVGMRGQGTYQLTLLSGDGRSWVYEKVSNPSRVTTKFNIGKGLHTSYLAWELTNQDGQDFDFEVVELVPMMSGRRIG